MPADILPLPSECIIVFDIDEQKYLSIGPLPFLKPGTVTGQINFWFDVINAGDIERVRHTFADIKAGQAVEASYHILGVNSAQYYITEKRSVYLDSQTGHKILTSFIKQGNGHAEALMREQFLHSLIDSQTNFLMRLDKDGIFTFVNKQFLAVFGFKKHEIIGKSFLMMTMEKDMELCQKAFKDCISHPGKVIHIMHDKLDKKGAIHHTEWEFISVTDENGEVSAIQGVGQDITQKIQIQSQVKRTSEKLDIFIESVTDSFFIVDNDWRFLTVNAAFEKLTRKNRKDMLGEVIWDIFPQIKDTGFEAAYKKAFAKKKSVQMVEYIAALKIWLRASIYPSPDGITAFITDITDQKIAQEELTWTKNNLESLINNTSDLIWSMDKEGRYIYTNNAYKKTVERDTGNRPVEGELATFEGYSDAITQQWQDYYNRSYNGETYSIVNENHHPSSNTATSYEVSFNPIYKNNGEITGVGCFARDITERLRTEKALIDQNERLRQIASLSSHELRRPVASMLGLISLVDIEHFNNPENKEIISYLLVVGKEIDEVIRLIVGNTFVD